MDNPSLKRDVEVLFEIGTFRLIDRVWKQFLSPEVANNAEHTLRVTWIALTLSRYEKSANIEALIKMALLHDLPETRCGDVHYLSRQYVERKETDAVRDMFAGTAHEEEMIRLFHEYEARETLESKIVKDADTLDVEMETWEMTAQGNTLGALLTEDRERVVYPKLYTETAKRLWREIHQANPHDWHIHSPQNRFHKGDWSVSDDGQGIKK